MQRRDFLNTSKNTLLFGLACSCLSASYDFNNPKVEHLEDVIYTGEKYIFIKNLRNKLYRIQRVAGFGNFNILSFDDALIYAKRYKRVGAFSKEELNFIEELFYQSASKYGFYGKKVIHSLTQSISRKNIIKVPYTGHFMYKNNSYETYLKIRKDVGKNLILTSGVRGLLKQIYLFLNKAVATNGNLSLASRSLAPPGYSYHSIGDFDIGKLGYGARNFTEDFAKTYEFEKLIDLGYIDIRYHKRNSLGVRYEPWHIKID